MFDEIIDKHHDASTTQNYVLSSRTCSASCTDENKTETTSSENTLLSEQCSDNTLQPIKKKKKRKKNKNKK